MTHPDPPNAGSAVRAMRAKGDVPVSHDACGTARAARLGLGAHPQGGQEAKSYEENEEMSEPVLPHDRVSAFARVWAKKQARDSVPGSGWITGAMALEFAQTRVSVFS